MAHKNAGQLERLIHALSHEQCDVYIHLDKKVALAAYAHLADLPRVRFIQDRRWARWASYRFTEAILQGTREILASGIPYDFINLISGQDYPIKPVEAIYQFFARNRGCSFLSFEPQKSAWWQQAVARVEQYHLLYFNVWFSYKLQALLNYVLPKRQFPLPYTLYGGPDGSWWTLGTDCAAYLIKFIDQHPKVRRFSRFTWGSDEFLIATILMNSPFKDRIVNNNYRYIDWSTGGSNPKILTIDDAPKLAKTPKLFARKFDTTQDATILDAVDRLLTGAPAGPPPSPATAVERGA